MPAHAPDDHPSPNMIDSAKPTIAAHGAREALAAIAADLVELGCDVSDDPLGWPGYRGQLEVPQSLSGEAEAVVVADGTIGRRRATIVAFDFGFLGGSMGEATGRRITHAFAHAQARRQPLVSLVASGGARMQEGMRSLVQLQRLVAARAGAGQSGDSSPQCGPKSKRRRNVGIAGIECRRDLGSFRSERVMRVRVRGDGGAGSGFTADAKQAAGFIDVVAPADELPALLSRYIDLLADPAREPGCCPLPEPRAHPGPPSTGWSAVQRARSRDRPRAAEYLDRYFNERVPISGDRVSGIDRGILCGFGRRDGRTVAYAAQTGSRNSAAGFRTVTRLVRLADRLGVPILTLIDTPGTWLLRRARASLDR
jgi:hypothetical protein